MSKQQKEPSKSSPITNAYSVARKNSGYFILKHSMQDGKVLRTEPISEPDVLVICMSNLERFVRKDNGL